MAYLASLAASSDAYLGITPLIFIARGRPCSVLTVAPGGGFLAVLIFHDHSLCYDQSSCPYIAPGPVCWAGRLCIRQETASGETLQATAVVTDRWC